jgi:hypothetical protein
MSTSYVFNPFTGNFDTITTPIVQSAFDAENSSSITLANTTYTDLLLDTVKNDTLSAYNTSTGEYTIPAGGTGWYLVTVNVLSNAYAGYFFAAIAVNGGIYAQLVQANDAGYGGSANVTRIIAMSPGDTFKAVGFQASAGSQTFVTGCSMSIARVK